MKTSVVIPATNGNFGYLNCILRHYEDGTELPDEVIISLSNAHLVDQNEIDDLERKFIRSFSIKVLRHNKTMIQGPNRDAASRAATNDIIISNDADDIPHPRRVEIIRNYFESHKIAMLNHCYISHTQRVFPDIKSISVLDCDKVLNHHFPNHVRDEQAINQQLKNRRLFRPNPSSLGFSAPYGGGLQWSVHAGNVAVHKNIFNFVSWRHTEEVAWDYDFCMDVLYAFNKSIIIDSPLIWYNLLLTRRDKANAEDLGVLYKE